MSALPACEICAQPLERGAQALVIEGRRYFHPIHFVRVYMPQTGAQEVPRG